ncbi:MAG: hypothetical protein WD022_04215 [Balneolaceae bacterium]
MNKINFEAPGIYLFPHDFYDKKECRFGSYTAFVIGHLGSSYKKNGWTLFLDGILIDRPKKELSDAEFALELFLEKGIKELQQTNGFYNILIINSSGSEILFLSDLLCNRTWYLYQNDKVFGLSPSPVYFSKLNFDTSLNEQALYEQIRLLHTGGERTLVNEIKRILPGKIYKISENTFHQIASFKFKQEPDHSLNLDECSEELANLCRTAIQGVINHPKLKDLPTQLPLTGGLDSRHLLGELFAQGKPPELLRHILIQQKDYVPVKKMADDLKLPLKVNNLEQINTKINVKRWVNRSGGLVNIHQYYLLDLKNGIPQDKTISFNGYLMDILLGLAVKTDKLDSNSPHKTVWNRTYSSPTIRKLLIPNEAHWSKVTEELFINEIEQFEGEPWFKMLMLDIHHRGLHYTGIVDSILADEVFSFSPGATIEAYRFAATSPHEIAGDKKARLHALQKYFPKMAAYPGLEGKSFADMEIRPEIIEHPFKKNLKLIIKTILSGFKQNYNAETEHSWIRNHPDLHIIHKNMIFDSKLAEDGYIRNLGLKTCWKLNQMGGYQGWTLMSLLSAEVAYRILIKGEDEKNVLNWLHNPIN